MISSYNDISKNGVVTKDTEFLECGDQLYNTGESRKLFFIADKEKPTRQNKMLIARERLVDYMTRFPSARPVDIQNYFGLTHCTALNYHRKYHDGWYSRPSEIEAVVCGK